LSLVSCLLCLSLLCVSLVCLSVCLVGDLVAICQVL